MTRGPTPVVAHERVADAHHQDALRCSRHGAPSSPSGRVRRSSLCSVARDSRQPTASAGSAVRNADVSPSSSRMRSSSGSSARALSRASLLAASVSRIIDEQQVAALGGQRDLLGGVGGDGAHHREEGDLGGQSELDRDAEVATEPALVEPQAEQVGHEAVAHRGAAPVRAALLHDRHASRRRSARCTRRARTCCRRSCRRGRRAHRSRRRRTRGSRRCTRRSSRSGRARRSTRSRARTRAPARR